MQYFLNLQVVNDTPKFYAELNAGALKAEIPRGQLLRIALPFDEETSSSDQSSLKSKLNKK
jgi:hypothetical protein